MEHWHQKKSWYWLIEYDWHKGTWQYKDNTRNENISTSTLDMNGKEVNLSQLKCNEAKEMLGVWLAPDGNNKKQKQVMIEKMQRYGEYIRTGHVSK